MIAHAGGFVGINHYQSAKVGVAAIPVIKKRGGKLVIVANTTDDDPVGSPFYRTALHLLEHLGPEKFINLIHSDYWGGFLPEQWQVQMWAKLFEKISFDDFVYYSPQTKESDYLILPGENGNAYLPTSLAYKNILGNIPRVIRNTLKAWTTEMGSNNENNTVSIAFMADGYGLLS